MTCHIALNSKTNWEIIKYEWLDDIIINHSESDTRVKLTEISNCSYITSSIKFHLESVNDLINEIYDKDWQSLNFKNFDKKRKELDSVIEQLTFDFELLNINHFHQIYFSIKLLDKKPKKKIYEITKRLFKNVIGIHEFIVVGKNQSQMESFVDFTIHCKINRAPKTNSLRKKNYEKGQ
jgi:hypothetical protein